MDYIQDKIGDTGPPKVVDARWMVDMMSKAPSSKIFTNLFLASEWFGSETRRILGQTMIYSSNSRMQELATTLRLSWYLFQSDETRWNLRRHWAKRLTKSGVKNFGFMLQNAKVKPRNAESDWEDREGDWDLDRHYDSGDNWYAD